MKQTLTAAGVRSTAGKLHVTASLRSVGFWIKLLFIKIRFDWFLPAGGRNPFMCWRLGIEGSS